MRNLLVAFLFFLPLFCSSGYAQVGKRPLKPCCLPAGVESAFTGELWPGGIVPYVFDSNVTAANQKLMLAAMKEWENVAPVKFIPRVSHKDYVHIKDDKENWSYVGKIGGKQEIGIYNWGWKYIMVHELCHALGFHHTQSRPDRNIFVTIANSHLNNVNYKLVKEALVTCSYDFDSVMHYSPSTILTVNAPYNVTWKSPLVGQRTHLSVGDIRGMQIAYGEKNRAPSWYGFPSSTTDYMPTFHSDGEFATLGNTLFGVTARNLTGNTAGLVYLSMDHDCLRLPSSTVYVDPLQGFPIVCGSSGSPGVPGTGGSSVIFSIPNQSWLVGTRLHLQGFYFEPGGNLGHTHGLWATIQSSISKDVTALYHRTTYKQHVTSAAAGLAVWNANKVTGFTYVKTQQFSCGGQSHWMVIVKDNTYNIEFMLIPGGSYQMGDLNNMGLSYEKPVHWVHLEPFLLARTEVTQGQFQAVMGTTPWKGKSYVWTGANASAYAASYIDWHDSTAFCAKLGCRLPSESEWEYACRGGTTTAYHYGSNSSTNLGQYAWYEFNANQRYAHQVGQKLPNAFGLRDMYGNVYEWCQDRWHDDFKGAPTNGLPWETGSSARRVFRGGYWDSNAINCRSATRGWDGPSFRNGYLGLRPARSLR